MFGAALHRDTRLQVRDADCVLELPGGNAREWKGCGGDELPELAQGETRDRDATGAPQSGLSGCVGVVGSFWFSSV